MRALVTGASGFVGRHLTNHLLACGDEVMGSDRSDGGPDIVDPAAVAALVRQVKPEVVYHLAGDADVGGSWDHPNRTFRVNTEGTLNVLAACRAANVARVLCVGSADMYGKVSRADLPLKETAPLRPVSPYAASKVAADFLALQAFEGYSQTVIRARPFNHLGPGQSESFVAPALATRIARNELTGGTTVPVGNLTPERDFTDVRDVTRAYRLLMLQGRGGEAYNVCSGASIAVRQLAERLLGLAAAPMHLTQDPGLERPVDIPVLIGDNTKLRETTGWTPEISVEVTLHDLLEDARARVREQQQTELLGDR